MIKTILIIGLKGDCHQPSDPGSFANRSAAVRPTAIHPINNIALSPALSAHRQCDRLGKASGPDQAPEGGSRKSCRLHDFRISQDSVHSLCLNETIWNIETVRET